MSNVTKMDAIQLRGVTGRQRLRYLDVAKGIGLILVIFGHLFRYGGRFSTLIFSFHMPLFFIISGYCFNPEQQENIEGVIGKKIQSLIIPYLFYCISGTIISLIVPLWRSELSLKTYFNQVFYLAAPEEAHVGQVWFLVCLFFVEVFAYVIYKYILKDRPWWFVTLILCLLAFIGYHSGEIAGYYFTLGRMPWKLDSSITALVYYLIGYYLRKQGLHEWITHSSKAAKTTVFVTTSLAVYILSTKCLGWVNISSLAFGNNIILYYLCAALGTLSVISLSTMLSEISFLRIFGKQSMFVFSVHAFFLYGVIYMYSCIYGYTIQMGVNPPHDMIIVGGISVTLLLIGLANYIDRHSQVQNYYVRKIFTWAGIRK